MPSKGELAGVQIQPREITHLAYSAGVKDADELAIIVCVALAESQGFSRASNVNLSDSGVPKSKDCGIWQINIPASEMGTDAEENLYDPTNNAKAMYQKLMGQGLTAWVAYTTHTYLHDTYLQRGCLGVFNYLVSRRVDAAKAVGAYQKTPVPVFSIKQLPYYQTR